VQPSAALLLFALGWNLIGDALRAALDPKMRGCRVKKKEKERLGKNQE